MSAVRLRPLSDKIVVLPDEQAKLSAGGIHLPPRANERPQVGEVIAVGPGLAYATDDGVERMEMVVQKGDRIFFGKYSGTELEVNRLTYIVLRQPDVLAILDPEDDGE